jgi:hypothetical protein
MAIEKSLAYRVGTAYGATRRTRSGPVSALLTWRVCGWARRTLAAFMIGRGLTEEAWCWFIARASLSATMWL